MRLQKQLHQILLPKLLVVAFFAFAGSASLSAQTYIKPPFKSSTTPAVELLKVETTKTETIVYFKIVSPESFVYGGWACASPDMYLEDVNTLKRYYLTKAKGIPICPEKHYFNAPGEYFLFQLHFSRLESTVRYMNIVEKAVNGFNFMSIYLKPAA